MRKPSILFSLLLPLLLSCTEDTGHIEFAEALGQPHDLNLGRADVVSAQEPIRPLPTTMPVDKAVARLGDLLYHDTRLSGDQTLSCASCHVISQGGDDNRATSVGIGGAIGPINAPTTLNSSFNLAQFWDGRAADLQEQAAGPVHNPMEMGSSWEEVIPRLQAVEDYVHQFDTLYDDGITGENITHAIAEFERSLITPSPFDEFLRGNTNAISAEAQNGYRLFKSYGCVSCHQGINVGGNLFQKFGALISFYEDREVNAVDSGRMNVTQQAEDKFVFKVPSLRNAADTGPYFHNASASTLQDAILIMGQLQLGKTLPQNDINDIEHFIHSLTGTVSKP